MFECKYKFELSDSIICAKHVYNSQKRKQDKIIAILVPILLVCTIALLVADIINKRNFVWDIVLICALTILEVLHLTIPVMLVKSQKKSYQQQKLGEMDYLLVKVENNLCTETLFKDNKEMAKNVHNLRSLTSYLEDNERLILVFNKVEFVCLRKNNISGGLDKVKAHLEKCMAKAK